MGRAELTAPVRYETGVCSRYHVQTGVNRYRTAQQAVKMRFVCMNSGF